MGTAYLGRVISKSGDQLKVHIFQTHPDYPLNIDDLLIDFGAFSLAGWGVSPDAPNAQFVADTGLSYDGMFDSDAESVAPHVEVVGSELLRTRFNDDNRDERLVEAGYPVGTPLTRDVVLKICGVLELDLKVANPEWLEDTAIGAEWDY